MASHYIGIWGIERSGTNWLEILLKKNFPKTIVTSFAKHEPRHNLTKDQSANGAEPYKDIAKYIAIIKNPYSWAYSNCVKWKREVRPRFNRLRRPIRDFKRRITEYYNYCNESYIHMKEKYPDKIFIVTYDNMLKDGEDFWLKKISEHFDISLKENFASEKRIVGPVCRLKNKPFDESFYLEKRYLKHLGEGNINFITNNVSKKVMDYCSFKHEEISDVCHETH